MEEKTEFSAYAPQNEINKLRNGSYEKIVNETLDKIIVRLDKQAIKDNRIPFHTQAGNELIDLQVQLRSHLLHLQTILRKTTLHGSIDIGKLVDLSVAIKKLQVAAQDNKEYRTNAGSFFHAIESKINDVCNLISRIIDYVKNQEHVDTPQIYSGGYKSTFYKDASAIVKGVVEEEKPPVSPKSSK